MGAKNKLVLTYKKNMVELWGRVISVKCSKCGTEFSGNFCPNCGMPMDEKSQPPMQDYPKCTANPFWDKIVTCKTCGHKIAKTANRCPYCGARQHQGALTACYLIIVIFIATVFYILFNTQL